MTCTPATLVEVVARCGGVLGVGDHRPDSGQICILEAVSVCDGVPWTDDPSILDRPDVRALNDGPWPSDAARTAGMLRLAPLLSDWPAWSVERRNDYLRRVALRTVRELLASVLRGYADAARCERVADLDEAVKIAYVAMDAAIKRDADDRVVDAIHAARAAVERVVDAIHAAGAAVEAAGIKTPTAAASRVVAYATAKIAYAAPRNDRLAVLESAVTIWASEHSS